MAQSLNEVISAQIEHVNKNVPMLFERDHMFYSWVDAGNEGVVISRRDMRCPMELRPGGQFSYASLSGESLGRGTGTMFTYSSLRTVETALALEWDFEAEWSTDNRRKAVMDAVKRNIVTGMDEYARHVEGQAMGKGNGILATASANISSGVVRFDNDGFGAKLLRPQQKVDIYASGSNTKRSGNFYIQSIAEDFKSAVVTSNRAGMGSGGQTAPSGTHATGIQNGDRFVASKAVINDDSKNLRGVAYHADWSSTGSWQGLNRANFPEIRVSHVDANKAISLSFPRRVVNYIGDRLGDDAANDLVAWMHPSQIQAFEMLGQSLITISKKASAEGLNLYFDPKKLTIAGVNVMKSFMWDRRRIDFTAKSKWGRATMKQPKFIQGQSGGKTFDVYASDGGVETSVLAYVLGSYQFFHKLPSCGAVVHNLRVPTGY